MILQAKHCRTVLITGLACGLSACATTAPDPKPPSYLADERAAIAGAPHAILGDVCVVRDVTGSGDHILRKQTQDITQAALASLSSRLQGVGVSLAKTAVPTACAGLERVGIPPRVAETWNADVSTLDDQVFTTDANLPAADAQLNRRLVAAVSSAIDDAEGGYKRRALDISDDDRAALREQAESDVLWVLAIIGIDVSAAKGFLSGGSDGPEDCDRIRDSFERRECERDAEQALQNADRFSYTLALVDLSTYEMVWFNNTNNVPGPPYEPSNFGAEWAQRVVSPFYQ
ncbi:hypothetical protein GYB61_02520 [bacterium]|nr:hypothetical protein [bacterium]